MISLERFFSLTLDFRDLIFVFAKKLSSILLYLVFFLANNVHVSSFCVCLFFCTQLQSFFLFFFFFCFWSYNTISTLFLYICIICIYDVLALTVPISTMYTVFFLFCICISCIYISIYLYIYNTSYLALSLLYRSCRVLFFLLFILL